MKTLFFLLLLSSFCFAQNTITLTEGAISPKAVIADASFLEGHWKGTLFGGKTEEIWTAPEGNSILFTFRLVIEGLVDFYEIGHIIEKDNSLVLQLKHFDASLKGLEEKDETENFKLVKKDKNKLFFEGLTYEKISDTELVAHVVVENEDGTTQELTFNFKKQ
ncbi:hypothetical protein KO500_14975 [Cellulophaga baltica]|uniref:DUF6265 family protein n=1 Tax=Cellulophaga TaxID=104264 RepID=UPI001C068187|nr:MULTISPECIES: DUF6265 family protein [Cellulophaga]MBU2997751.1 hypothetical protein [Cellulophaga baltica]MDO6769147.1 DUF6265 family protein [Cellulophaga sp. 1_MG-2023]